ncbi:MAG: ABC transporter permease [Solirubrobacterales bacterium]
MFSLVQNENLKLYPRKSTLILIAITLLLGVLPSLFIQAYLKFPGLDNVQDRVITLAGTMWFVQVFWVIVAAGILANEYSWGTIRLLLIRPASRGEILFSKYLALLGFGLFLTGLLFGTAFLLNVLLLGPKGLIGGLWVALVQSATPYLLKLVPGIVYGTLAFALSVLVRNQAGAIVSTLLIVFIGDQISSWFSGYPWAKYLVFSHTDLSIYFQPGAAQMIGMTPLFPVTVLLVYCLVFYLGAWLVFSNRDVM